MLLNASLIVTIVRKGWGNTVLEASVKAGARGGTVVYGRGIGVNEHEKIFGIAIEPEKEIVPTVVYADKADTILQEIVRAAELTEPNRGLAFVVALEKVVDISHLHNEQQPG